MSETVDFVQISDESWGGVGTSISTTGTFVDSIDVQLNRLHILSMSLRAAHEAHLISGEHASAIYKKYLKEWGFDAPRRKGGE